MIETLGSVPATMWWAVGSITAGLAVLVWLVVVPPDTVPLRRRRAGVIDGEGVATRATAQLSSMIGRTVLNGGRGRAMGLALDRAGVRRDPAEFVILVVGFAITAFAPGYLIAGPLLGLLFAVVTVGVIALVVMLRSEARKRAFADDLDDIVTLLATNVRAGHSLLQALDTVAQEVDDPAKTEIARAVNQVRLGRDLSDAVDETAERMGSDDFRWVSQAIAIHRQVGGNLGHVLDTIGVTIRDRGRIRRQVRALSAEGRLSAWVLLALPIFTALALMVINPTYLAPLVTTPIGYALIFTAVVLMGMGSLWLKKVVEVKF